MWTSLALTVALCALAQDTPPGPAGFRSLEFEVAEQAALSEDRVLLVDFYDPESTEWKVMQTLTWRDPVVTRWLDARVVAVQYDIHTHADLAKQLKVDSAPTCLFLTPRGHEIDRLVGLVEARPLMAEGQTILGCGDRVAEARILLAKDANDPEGRLQLAIAYLACSRRARALTELLWLWDHGAERPEYRARRLSELPRYLARIILQYPPARDSIVQRRDALQAALEEPAEGDDLAQRAMDLGALNTALGAERRQLQLFERFAAKPDAPRAVVDALFNKLVVDALVRDKRWKDLLAGRGDVAVWLDREYIEINTLARIIERGEGVGLTQSPEALLIARNGVVFAASNYVEALCATGSVGRARDAIGIVLLNDPRTHAHQLLLRACLRADALELAREVLASAEKLADDPEELGRLRALIAAAEEASRSK